MKSQTLDELVHILRAKDIRKNVSILQKGGFTPASLTLLAIRVVLLHTLYGVLNPLIPQLYVCNMQVYWYALGRVSRSYGDGTNIPYYPRN